jgi:hypothetical protein
MERHGDKGDGEMGRFHRSLAPRPRVLPSPRPSFPASLIPSVPLPRVLPSPRPSLSASLFPASFPLRVSLPRVPHFLRPLLLFSEPSTHPGWM